jgi:hypothetical protein
MLAGRTESASRSPQTSRIAVCVGRGWCERNLRAKLVVWGELFGLITAIGIPRSGWTKGQVLLPFFCPWLAFRALGRSLALRSMVCYCCWPASSSSAVVGTGERAAGGGPSMSVLARIKDIEDEMARTQKNKATNSHLGLLKARLAKLKSELVTAASAGGGGGSQEGKASRSPSLLPPVHRSRRLHCAHADSQPGPHRLHRCPPQDSRSARPATRASAWSASRPWASRRCFPR